MNRSGLFISDILPLRDLHPGHGDSSFGFLQRCVLEYRLFIFQGAAEGISPYYISFTAGVFVINQEIILQNKMNTSSCPVDLIIEFLNTTASPNQKWFRRLFQSKFR